MSDPDAVVVAAAPSPPGLDRAPAPLRPSPRRPVPLRTGRFALTAALTGTLTATALWLAFGAADPEATLRWASSNVDNLVDRPVQVLVVSALVLPAGTWLPSVAMLAAGLVPLERRVGSGRALLVVLSGQVLSTLVTQGVVGLGIALGRLPVADASQLDVGISYVTRTAVGASLALLPRRWRAALTAVGAVVSLVPLVRAPDVTSAGHALSFLVGLAWWPVVRRAGTPGTLPTTGALRAVRQRSGPRASGRTA